METDKPNLTDNGASHSESQSSITVSVTSKASARSRAAPRTSTASIAKTGKPTRKPKPTTKKTEQGVVDEDLRKGVLKPVVGRTTNNSMSSARRQPRSNARAGPHDSGEEQQMWKRLFPQVQQLGAAEVRAKQLKDQIVDLEFKMKEKLTAGGSEYCCLSTISHT